MKILRNPQLFLFLSERRAENSAKQTLNIISYFYRRHNAGFQSVDEQAEGTSFGCVYCIWAGLGV